MNLSRADLSEADLAEALLIEARLEAINASRALFDGADLTHARMAKARVPLGQFGRATLPMADLSGAALAGATFAQSNLTAANLAYTNLERANLEETSLQRVCLRGASLAYANLRLADLSYADLREVRMFRTHLYCTHLEFADLTGADLSTFTLWSGYLGGAVLTEASLDLKEVCEQIRDRWSILTEVGYGATGAGARHAAKSLQTLAHYFSGSEFRDLIPLLRRAASWWSPYSAQDRQDFRRALASVEAASEGWKGLPVPSQPPSGSAARPIPAAAPRSADITLPLPVDGERQGE